MAGPKLNLLDDAVAEYELHLMRRPITENSRKAFAGDVKIFAREMQASQPLKLNSITSDRIRDFLDTLEKRPGVNSPKSLERRLTSLKVFFNWLHESGQIAINPADPIAYRAFEDPLPEYLSDETVDEVVKAAHIVAAGEHLELRPLTAILLVLDTGMKKAECLNLTLDDFGCKPGQDCAPERVHIRYDKVHLKFKDRALAISPETGKAVQEHIQRYGCRDKLIECTGRNLEYKFNRLIAPLVGIPSLTFEMLRWTAALRDYRAALEAGTIKDDHFEVKYGLSPLGWTEMEAKLKRVLKEG